MSFPSTFSTFTHPNPSDRLNNPSHSDLHNTVSSAVGQLEAVIGTDSSILGTIIGDLRSASSGGGGHIQAVNKGGTGLTGYTKGDILVAQSSSVLTKLSVSSVSGQVLTVDPNAAVGVKWAQGSPATKLAISTSSVVLSGGAASVVSVMYSASILGSTLGTNNAFKYRGYFQNLNVEAGTSLTLNTVYGNNNLGSAGVVSTGMNQSAGFFEGYIVGTGNVSSQLGRAVLQFGTNAVSTTVSNGFNSSNGNVFGSVLSDAPQNLIVTAQFSTGNAANSIMGGLFVVEKIS